MPPLRHTGLVSPLRGETQTHPGFVGKLGSGAPQPALLAGSQVGGQEKMKEGWRGFQQIS